MKLTLLLFFFWLNFGNANAEPWLGTRYAQNCAGCHAPARINLKPVDRRCTLSCQGCHISPSGGGLRSQYGKWNEQRWLTMFRSKSLGTRSRPAPYSKQTYGLDTEALQELVETDELLDERLYDRRDGREFIVAKDRQQFELNIARDDPYYYLGESYIDGGADLRYLNYRAPGKNRSFLMSMDLGVRYRPFRRHLNLVYEARFLGSPLDSSPEAVLDRQSVKSLYVLIDDQPYNTFAQFGYFLPLFGNYTSDHTSLTQQVFATALTGSPTGAYGISLRALSLGTAPNVPFANVHIFDKLKDGNKELKHEGHAVNLGLRFVTLGGTVNYSHWSSKMEHANGDPITLGMHSLNLAMQLLYNRIYLSWEGLLVEKDSPAEFVRVSLSNYQSRIRLWRESYLELDYATSNAAADFTPGDTIQYSYGLRAFLLPGLDLSLKRVENIFKPEEGGEQSEYSLVSELHMYL